MEFTYNHEGIRTQKVKKINDEVVETTDYTLAGKKIICMQKGNDRLLFHYDESGSLIMLRHNGTPYTYVKNLQGDIVGLIDSTGALVVEYKYDAWGNPISTRTLTSAYDALAELNPFKYRGYMWDEETDMFYLNNRYYVSHISRFLNADHLVDVNLYAYCLNNPVNRIDTNGTRSKFIPEKILRMAEKAVVHEIVVLKVSNAVGGLTERKDTIIKGAGPRGGAGYADVRASNYIWEVKPMSLYGTATGAIQINRYCSKTGCVPGYPVSDRIKQPINVTIGGKKASVYIIDGQFLLDAGVVYYHIEYPEEDEGTEGRGQNTNPDTSELTDNIIDGITYAIGAAGAAAIITAIPSIFGGGFGASGAMVEIFP